MLQLPKTEIDWRAIADQFNTRWNFPHCLGSVDGKHVQILAPEHSGSLFFNYKGTFSIVLLGVADSNYNFIYADVGCQGRISDVGVFKHTSLYKSLEEKSLNVPGWEALPGRTCPVPFVFVADDAFALSTYMMKPYPGHKPGSSTSERVYNYRLSRARRIIENVFGIMSSKFRVLLKPIPLAPEKAEVIVLSCTYLYNFCAETVYPGVTTLLLVFLIHMIQMGTWLRGPGGRNWMKIILWLIYEPYPESQQQTYTKFGMNSEIISLLLKERFHGNMMFIKLWVQIVYKI